MKMLEGRDCPRRLVNGVVPTLRHRPMRGHTLRLGVKPERALVTDVWIIRCRLTHDDGAGPAERALLANQVEGAYTTDFLTGRYDQFKTWRSLELCRQRDGRSDKRGHTAFHITGTSSVKPTLIRFAGERILAPCSRAERNRINVSGQA